VKRGALKHERRSKNGEKEGKGGGTFLNGGVLAAPFAAVEDELAAVDDETG